MANAAASISRVRGEYANDGYQATWALNTTNTQGNPVGSPVDGAGNGAPNLGFIAGYADKTVQFTFTGTAPTAMIFEGSNDGVNFFTLSTPAGTPITGAAAGLFAVTEAVIQMRPRITGGDGTTVVTAILFARKTQTP